MVSAVAEAPITQSIQGYESSAEGLLRTKHAGKKRVTQMQAISDHWVGTSTACCGTMIALAALIVGIVAAAGGMGAMGAGATALGLGVPMIAMKVLNTWKEPNKGGALVKKIFYAVTALALLVISAFTLAGLLPGVAIGATMTSVAAMWMMMGYTPVGESKPWLQKFMEYTATHEVVPG